MKLSLNPFREVHSYFLLKYYKSKRRISRIEELELEKQKNKLKRRSKKGQFTTVACGLQSAMQVSTVILSNNDEEK